MDIAEAASARECPPVSKTEIRVEQSPEWHIRREGFSVLIQTRMGLRS